jgi:hypothetical protein
MSSPSHRVKLLTPFIAEGQVAREGRNCLQMRLGMRFMGNGAVKARKKKNRETYRFSTAQEGGHIQGIIRTG